MTVPVVPVGRVLVTAIALTLSACAPSSQNTLEGLLPQPAVTLYVVGNGQPATANLIVRRRNGAPSPRVMIRAFDGEENLSFWSYHEPGRMHATYDPDDGGISITEPPAIRARADEVVWKGDIPLGGNGVQQIRVIAGARNSAVTFKISHAQGWGVSFQNGSFSSWDNQQSTLYAYVPPHAEWLDLAGGPVEIYNENGDLLAATSRRDLKNKTRIRVERTEVVWRFEFPQPGKWEFRAAGFPLILSPTIEAALQIRASVEVLADGTVVSHKFQRKIAELLPLVLAPENVGNSNELIDLIEPLTKYEEEWRADPVRNMYLVEPNGLLPSVRETLRTQNLDAASHWGGSTKGWRSRIDKSPPENRWDRLHSIDGLWAGASTRSRAAENLAQIALVDAPFNPLYGKTQLLYRAAAAALLDLMTLGEDEIFRGTNADMNPYPGAMAFVAGQKALPVFGLVAPYMPKDIRKVWTEGLRRFVDRTYADGLVNARNQSSHYLVAYQAFADGSGDQLYQSLARRWAERFTKGMHPAGFHIEKTGPDASYIGITHWYEAHYYRMSHDPAILESLARSYRFFNHTVAPEPDGRMIGGFNFNHRVADSFVNEQWGGARGLVDDLLPDVGLWGKQLRERRAKNAVETLTRLLAEPQKPRLQNLGIYRYLYFSEPSASGVWPAQSKQSFIRQFGDEMIAVKRPTYYVVIYVGKPALGPAYIPNKKYFQKPLPHRMEETGGKLKSKKKITPYLGGGMSLFWTPQYGTVFVGTNLSPLAHHGLVAVRRNNTRTWEDYFATGFKLDRGDNTLTVTGRIESQPIIYERRYRFDDDALVVSLTLTATSNVDLAALIENLPLAMGTIKRFDVEVALENKGEAEIANTSTLNVRDRVGAGVEVTFDKPRAIRVQRNGIRQRNLQVGRIEIRLPTTYRAGESVRLQYRIVPLQNDRAGGTDGAH